jgi:O-antigen/teichoic acid export membrane protein
MQLAFVLLATRSLSETEFGRYAIASAVLLLGGFLADVGTTPAIVRLISRSPGDAATLLSGTLAASAAWGIVAWAISTGATVLVYGGASTGDVALAGVSLPFLAVTSSLHAGLDGSGRIAARAWAALAHPVVAAGLGGLAVHLTGNVRFGLASLVAGSAASTLVAGTITGRAGLWTRDLIPRRAAILRVLRIAGPFALLAGFGTLSMRFDVLFLGHVDGPSQAASYDIALRGTEVFWSVQTAVTAPALYLLSRRLGSGDMQGAQRGYSLALRLSYLWGGLVSALLLGLSDPIVGLLGAGSYEDAPTALAILGAAQWLAFAALVQGTLIMAGDHLREGILTAGVVTMTTVALDVALIPAFGVPGAAVAGAATSAVTVVGFSRLHRRTLGLRTERPRAGLAIALLAAATIAFGLRGVAALGAATATVAYLLICSLTLPDARADVRTLLTLVRYRRSGDPRLDDEL